MTAPMAYLCLYAKRWDVPLIVKFQNREHGPININDILTIH